MHRQRDLLQIVRALQAAGRLARAVCTAGNSSAINRPMIAITTSNSTSVKAANGNATATVSCYALNDAVPWLIANAAVPTAAERIARAPGSGTAVGPPADPAVWPKFDRTIVKSLMSTVPSPVNSPWDQAAPIRPKLDRTMVKSLMSTLPSSLASPGAAIVRFAELVTQTLNPVVLSPVVASWSTIAVTLNGRVVSVCGLSEANPLSSPTCMGNDKLPCWIVTVLPSPQIAGIGQQQIAQVDQAALVVLAAGGHRRVEKLSAVRIN